MMSLVTTRKRKESYIARKGSRDKGKIRVVEGSADGLLVASVPHTAVRSGTAAGRTISSLRKNSVKLFSIFRNGKRN